MNMDVPGRRVCPLLGVMLTSGLSAAALFTA